jgi:hypothetical protein
MTWLFGERISGSAGKVFVDKTSRLLATFTFERLSLKAVAVMTPLLLQKPHAKSTLKENIAHLERRMILWRKGDIRSLIGEGQTIQDRLEKIRRTKMSHVFFPH